MVYMDKDIQKYLNSVQLNFVLLSLTKVFGTPKRLKSSFNTFTVFLDIGCLHLNISDHLEKQSTIIR